VLEERGAAVPISRSWPAALLVVGLACTSGGTAAPSAPASPSPSPSRPPQEVADEVAGLLGDEISSQTGVETVVECPPEAAEGGAYECVARPADGGERRVFVEADETAQFTFRVAINARRLEQGLAGDVGAQLGVPVSLACPDDVISEAGASFACTATGDGGLTATVDVTQTDDAGGLTYEVTPSPPPDPAPPPPEPAPPEPAPPAPDPAAPPPASPPPG